MHESQDLEQDLCEVFVRISEAGRQIYQAISLSTVSNDLGSAASVNIQGEVQQKLDILAHNIFLESFGEQSTLAAIISEEAEHPIVLNQKTGRYLLAIDPLDGSSNIDVNAPIGSIFSLYSRTSSGHITHKEFLQPGKAQLAAGYILYGPSTLLVLAVGDRIYSFAYDTSQQEFFLAHLPLDTPKKGRIYSMNEGLYYACSPVLQQYIDTCKQKQYTARYIGSLVADFHRNLLKGGIYIYPSTSKHPQGKLRLMYECNPLALLIQCAGGRATNGRGESILELMPKDIHTRTPLYIGSKEMMEEADPLT